VPPVLLVLGQRGGARSGASTALRSTNVPSQSVATSSTTPGPATSPDSSGTRSAAAPKHAGGGSYPISTAAPDVPRRRTPSLGPFWSQPFLSAEGPAVVTSHDAANAVPAEQSTTTSSSGTCRSATGMVR
jgi:hypothetical protein